MPVICVSNMRATYGSRVCKLRATIRDDCCLGPIRPRHQYTPPRRATLVASPIRHPCVYGGCTGPCTAAPPRHLRSGIRNLYPGVVCVLAGAPGFEPGDGGIKIRCLTTWLRPTVPGRRTPRARRTISGEVRVGKTVIRSACDVGPAGERAAALAADHRPRYSHLRGPRRGSRCRSVAQPGSAPRSGRGGRRFESYHSDHVFPAQLHGYPHRFRTSWSQLPPRHGNRRSGCRIGSNSPSLIDADYRQLS